MLLRITTFKLMKLLLLISVLMLCMTGFSQKSYNTSVYKSFIKHPNPDSSTYQLSYVEVGKRGKHVDAHYRKEISYDNGEPTDLELDLSSGEEGFYITWIHNDPDLNREYMDFSLSVLKKDENSHLHTEIVYEDGDYPDRPQYLEFFNTYNQNYYSENLEYERVFRLSDEVIDHYKSLKDSYVDSVENMELPKGIPCSNCEFIRSFTSETKYITKDHYSVTDTDSLLLDGVLQIKLRTTTYKTTKETLSNGHIKIVTTSQIDSADVTFSETYQENIVDPNAESAEDSLISSSFYHYTPSKVDTLKIETMRRKEKEDGYEIEHLTRYPYGSPKSYVARSFFSKHVLIQYDKKGKPFHANAKIDFVNYRDKTYIVKLDKKVWYEQVKGAYSKVSNNARRAFLPHVYVSSYVSRKYRSKIRYRKPKPVPLKSYFRHFGMDKPKRIEKTSKKEVWEQRDDFMIRRVEFYK